MPVEVTAMKNLPSKRGSRLMRARFSASGSSPEMLSMAPNIARGRRHDHFRTWRPVPARAACVAPIALGPVRHLPQRPRLEPARPRLRPAAADDEPGTLEHLQMLRDRRLAHAEGLRELHHPRLPAGEAGERSSARRVGERGEGLVEAVGRHAYKTIWLYNRRVF